MPHLSFSSPLRCQGRHSTCCLQPTERNHPNAYWPGKGTFLWTSNLLFPCKTVVCNAQALNRSRKWCRDQDCTTELFRRASLLQSNLLWSNPAVQSFAGLSGQGYDLRMICCRSADFPGYNQSSVGWRARQRGYHFYEPEWIDLRSGLFPKPGSPDQLGTCISNLLKFELQHTQMRIVCLLFFGLCIYPAPIHSKDWYGYRPK